MEMPLKWEKCDRLKEYMCTSKVKTKNQNKEANALNKRHVKTLTMAHTG